MNGEAGYAYSDETSNAVEQRLLAVALTLSYYEKKITCKGLRPGAETHLRRDQLPRPSQAWRTPTRRPNRTTCRQKTLQMAPQVQPSTS